MIRLKKKDVSTAIITTFKYEKENVNMVRIKTRDIND